MINVAVDYRHQGTHDEGGGRLRHQGTHDEGGGRLQTSGYSR